MLVLCLDFCSPTKQQFGAVRRILKYMAGTINFGIWYNSVPNFKLVGFTDSDWGSKKQETVALSSSEAKYTAATSAVQQALWLRKLLADLQFEQNEATELFCDNRPTIAMAKNPAFHWRKKHIDVQHHFIQKLIGDGKIMLTFCGKNEQEADIFTKCLPQAKHDFFRSQLECVILNRG